MSNISERIAKIIENDENSTANRTIKVAQSDVAALLSEYMDITALNMVLDKSDDGYAVKITAHATRIYSIGNTSDSE